MSRDIYDAAFRRVMDYIAAGDVYQVNLTFTARFRFAGDPVALYRDLVRKQPVEHGALMRADDHWVLSAVAGTFPRRRGRRDPRAADEGHSAAGEDARRG